MVIPNNLKSDKLLKDRTVKMPNTHVTTPKILVAYMRDTENFSTTKVIAGSIREIEDVMAAKNSKIKKEVAMTPPKSIDPKAIGKVWNINPGPAVFGSRLYVKTIGKIIIPANIATNVSKKATAEPTWNIDVLSGRYEP